MNAPLAPAWMPCKAQPIGPAPAPASAALPRAQAVPADLAARYRAVRAATEALAAPLSEADAQVQAMPEASPSKWHLAHVTWFFETFVLADFEPGFAPHHPAYRVLFNSYYNGVGAQHPRTQRGLISRPSLAEVLAWRQVVDQRVLALLASPGLSAEACARIALGLQHEQQHQELLLTDLKCVLGASPLQPAYASAAALAPVAPGTVASPLAWTTHPGGQVDIGHAGSGFAFDNEGPRHPQWLAPHALAQRLVTEAEWADFMADGGYADARWWLAAGWDWVNTQQACAPLYWHRACGADGDAGATLARPVVGALAGTPARVRATDWQVYTLAGPRAPCPVTPVAHLNLYEADAYTRWWTAQHPGHAPARLPTEAEWEHAAAALGAPGAALAGLADTAAGLVLPGPTAPAGAGLQQAFGALWQWTSSAYSAYPGFRPWDGAVGEYNGKFMVNQYVLRGGSCATPRSHQRLTYRNFFPADARWQFTGLRLALDLA